MRTRVLVALSMVLMALSSGCFSGGAKNDASGTSGPAPASTSPDTGSNVSASTNNTPPAASLVASVENGTAPLLVNFTLDAADADGDALTWTLSIDGNETQHGDVLPAEANHTFDAEGNHTVLFTVSDGNASTNQSLVIVVAAGVPAGPPPPVTFTGTVTTPDSVFHNFALPYPVKSIVVTLTWGPAAGVGDLDLYVTSPKGTETSSADFNTPVAVSGVTTTTEKVTITDEALLAQTGKWSVEVFGFIAANTAYTAKVTFT